MIYPRLAIVIGIVVSAYSIGPEIGLAKERVPKKSLAIPSNYRGFYMGGEIAASAPTCTKKEVEERANDGIMIVESNRMSFWESSCEVVSIRSVDTYSLSLGMACSGEGEAWTAQVDISVAKIRSRDMMLVAFRNLNNRSVSVSAYERCL